MSADTPSPSAQLRALDEAMTDAPWEVGDRYHFAGVFKKGADLPVVGHVAPGECSYCAQDGKPIWAGRTDINGKRMDAHVHIREPYSRHEIVHWDGNGDVIPVAGNYDYEAGGIVTERDADSLVALRNALPAIADLVEAAEALLAAFADPSAGLSKPGAKLRDALASLAAALTPEEDGRG